MRTSMFKRLAAILSAVLLLMACLPLSAFAATIDPPADGNFTFLWTTDPQWYSFAYPEIIEHQNQWVLDNYKRLDIRYTFHTGDFVDQPNSDTQWSVMDKAYRLWDNADYPYGVLAGNHDVVNYKVDSTTGAVTELNHNTFSKYFGASRFDQNPWYGDSYEDNYGHYDLMTINGVNFIFVYMGYSNIDYPEAAYNWLNDVLKQHADRTAMLCFHDYLYANGTRSANGENIFQRVVLKNPNVRMVMCGHNYNSTRKLDQIDDNGDGKADRTVYQIMANYQSTTNGGNGFMRFMECDVNSGTITHRTYSPYTASFGSDYEDGKPFDEYGTRDSFTIPFDFTPPTPKASGDPEVGTVVYEPSVAFAATDSDTVIALPVTYQNVAVSGSYQGVGVYDRYFSADATEATSNPKALDYVIARYTQGKGYAVSWIVEGNNLADGEIVAIPHDGVVITLPDGTVDLNRLPLGRTIVAKNLNGITTPRALKPMNVMINGTLYNIDASNRLNGNNEWTIYDSLSGSTTRYAHTWDMLFTCTPISDSSYRVTAANTVLGTDKQAAIPAGGFVLAINTYSGGKALANSLRRLLPVGTTLELNGYKPGEGTTYNKQSILPPSASAWVAETNAAATTENGAQVLYKSGGADSGSWPAVDYVYASPITINPSAMALEYDYTLETNGKVNLLLYFNGTDASTATSATKLSIQQYLPGVNISSGSGDLKGDDVARKGKIDLSTVTFPDGAYNADGTLSLSAIRIMNSGYVGKKLILRDLSVSDNLTLESDDEVEQTIPLISPDITVNNTSLSGNYVYDNGQLTVTANSDSGYELTMKLNDAVKVSVLKNWLINIHSTAAFDVRLNVTTTAGDTQYGLVSEFGPAFASTMVNGCIPAGTYANRFDLLSCYTWNNVLPADGISTVKEVTVKLATAGTLTLHALQLTNATYGGYFADGITLTGTPTVLSGSLTIDSNDVLDAVDKDTTAAELTALMDHTDLLRVVDKNGNPVNGKLATGMRLQLVSNGQVYDEATVAVRGDVTEDGIVKTDDARAILLIFIGMGDYNPAQHRAADFTGDGIGNTTDVRQILTMALL